MSVCLNSALDENPSFLPDERVIAYFQGVFPRGVAALVAAYMTRHLDEVIFGPLHWKTFWGAIPVTLPSLEELKRRVVQSGRAPLNPVEEMSAEECANFVGELGEEDQPTPPRELLECLAQPIREGEKPAASTCAVTYIPQFIRKNGQIMAVTLRTLTFELGPNPVKGHVVQTTGPSGPTSGLLTKMDADATEPASYFVMELEREPCEEEVDDSSCVAQHIARGWDAAPVARNFMMTVFSRRVWKGDFPFAHTKTFRYCNVRSQNDTPMTLGCSSLCLRFVCRTIVVTGSISSTSASRKFTPQLPQQDKN